jgi:hypothetical protein
MSDGEKLMDNKTIIKIIISIVVALGARFSNFGEKKFIAGTAAAICAILTALHFYQETCSYYPCPDGYVKDESKKDTECGGIADFTCGSVDRDTCCKQKCSKYSCPTGYKGKDNSDKIYCKDSVCKESDDRDTCCNKSVDCAGSWSDFGECSLDCGGGTQTRTYAVTTQPQYGGTPCPTSPEPRPCNTQACETEDDGGAGGETVSCSTVSENCPTGYLYRTGAGNTPCAGSPCDVGIDGVDLDNCCLKWNCTDPFTLGTPPVGYVSDSSVENSFTSTNNVVGISCDSANGYYQLPGGITATCGDDTQVGEPSFTLGGCDQGCVQPTDITGYTNLPDVLPPSSGPVVMQSPAACADNYHGTPQSNCNTPGREYTLSDCDADVCTQPSDITGYNIMNVTSLERNNFSVNVDCADGYGARGLGSTNAYSGICPSKNTPYFLYGCNDKTGFCSGNAITSDDFTCTSGYSLKTNSNNIVGDTLDICCDQITPAEEPSGSQDTELPICSSVMVPNKVPGAILSETRLPNLQACSNLCRAVATCQSFAYTEINDDVGTPRSQTFNCKLGTSINSVSPPDNNSPLYRPDLSYSFYRKCRLE